MSRFEATPGLFWDAPLNFESLSEDEDDTCTGTPSPDFRTTPKRERLIHDATIAFARSLFHSFPAKILVVPAWLTASHQYPHFWRAASAVRCMMDSSRAAQRAVIQFLRAEGEHDSQIYRRMKQVYGEQFLARCTIFLWCQRYEEGRVIIKDLPRFG
ncbi:hypothetical protein AVEN_238873-1 [Araneus ventricosus]|uniref:Mos1 transposase HTH domain-containing protein n=1 Tax=Araneus ventricosus TaxID=182803 RepID=A0A4Y2INH5_ARAVE|nr:hypothetical protein AVEN_238873-1 [Araneus ventricosus]